MTCSIVLLALWPMTLASQQQFSDLPVRRLWLPEQAGGGAESEDKDAEPGAEEQELQAWGDFQVHIVAPRPGELVAGPTLVVAELTGEPAQQAVAVEFRIDGRLMFTDTEAPYELAWQAGPPDKHRIHVRAHGAGGRSAQDVLHSASVPIGWAADEIYDARVDRVRLFVRVETPGRSPLELSTSDFIVLEDGAPQQIVGVEKTAELPLAIGLMIDTSGSMVERFETALEAAGEFVDGLLRLAHDKAFIMCFADLPIVVQGFTNDVQQLRDSMALVFRGRYTKLYDSIVEAARQFDGQEGRRALVLLTDGRDQGSTMDLRNAIAAAQRANIAIYPVAVELPVRFLSERWVLSTLAEQTGGWVSFLEDRTDPQRIYELIAEDLRAQYRLIYEPSRTGGGGEWRTVEVRLRDRKHKRLRLRNRPGYYAE